MSQKNGIESRAKRSLQDLDLHFVFVPLPPERRAAWEYAMQIISKYMDLALLEMTINKSKPGK